jgi:hypothetical protein
MIAPRPDFVSLYWFSKINALDFVWTAASMLQFVNFAEAMAKKCHVTTRMEIVPELGGELPSYPYAFLMHMAMFKLQPRPRIESSEIGRLVVELGRGLTLGGSRSVRPLEAIRVAQKLKLSGLIAPKESADSPAVRSRVGLAVFGISGLAISGLVLEVVSKNRHRRYVISRPDPAASAGFSGFSPDTYAPVTRYPSTIP